MPLRSTCDANRCAACPRVLPHTVQQVKLLRSDIARALKAAGDNQTVEELLRAKAVLEGHGPGGDLRKLLKQPTPALLKLLLGNQCNLVTLQARPASTLPLREEHHAFRDRAAAVLFASAAQLAAVLDPQALNPKLKP